MHVGDLAGEQLAEEAGAHPLADGRLEEEREAELRSHRQRLLPRPHHGEGHLARHEEDGLDYFAQTGAEVDAGFLDWLFGSGKDKKDNKGTEKKGKKGLRAGAKLKKDERKNEGETKEEKKEESKEESKAENKEEAPAKEDAKSEKPAEVKAVLTDRYFY